MTNLVTKLITKIDEVPSRGAIHKLPIKGVEMKVVNIEGLVTYVRGESEPIGKVGDLVIYRKILYISLGNPDGHWETRFNFRQDFPVKKNHYLVAGIIAEEDNLIREAAYLALFPNYGRHAHDLYDRMDFMDTLRPTDEERSRIVFD